jgi:dihydrofolate synthase/folylpolyglutamate synthase
MSDFGSADDLAELEAVYQALLSRWPESKLEPSMDRIVALLDALGSPQNSYPVIHVGGTNGKTTTSRMIDAICRELGYRTGRFTSPHLESFTERISLKGEPISPQGMVAVYNDIALYLDLIDSRQPHPISFFEAMVALAFVAFAEYPVDIAVVEVGMGGEWDATNTVSSQVSVITPIGLDHMQYLGESIEEIALTKSGIIKPESHVVLAAQPAAVAEILMAQVIAQAAIPYREGVEFKLAKRELAVGGQVISVQGIYGLYEDIFLPLYGEHQGHNAALAIAAVEAYSGVALDKDALTAAFASVDSPGRCEIVHTDPTVIVDAAHNPHGAKALAHTLRSEFDFQTTYAIVAAMSDKDVDGILRELEPVVDRIVVTTNASERGMGVDDIYQRALAIFGIDRTFREPDLASAMTFAMEKCQLFNQVNDGVSGLVVTGSVVTAGLARLIARQIQEA